MSEIINYFGDMPTLHRTLLLVGGLSFFFILENTFPLFTTKYNKWKHSGINIFFTLTTVLVNFLLAFLLIMISDWTSEAQFGIVHWFELNPWLTLIIGVMIMDFIGAWLIHFIEHKVKFLWQFHLVHHTDKNVDTTTANRHHPGESVFRFAFTILAIFIVGAPIWLIFVYQSMSLVATQFGHSNLKFPDTIHKVISLLFVTPTMHRVHHHYRMPYSDKNYGNIFSIWDRIFGTFVEVDNEKLIYGLDTHMEDQKANNIWALLIAPFKKHKSHITYTKEEVL